MNFVSVALLATSIRLRLNLPAINVITKSDLIGERLGEILKWTSNLRALEDAISRQADGRHTLADYEHPEGMNLGGFAQGLIPVSNVTVTA